MGGRVLGALALVVATACGSSSNELAPPAADGASESSEIETSGSALVGSSVFPASATVTGSRIEGSARAGISSFGADVKLSTTTLECNAIHLDGEAFKGVDFTFEDLGKNVCGCSGASVVCQILSSGLSPPEPLKGP